jgi:hypothetical protein
LRTTRVQVGLFFSGNNRSWMNLDIEVLISVCEYREHVNGNLKRKKKHDAKCWQFVLCAWIVMQFKLSNNKWLYYFVFFCTVQCNIIGGRHSSVGIATRYGMDGSGIESRCGRDFPHPSRPAPGPIHSPVQWGTGSFPGVKRPGRGTDHPPPSKRRGHERVELYLYSPSGPSWPVIGRTFTLQYNINPTKCTFLNLKFELKIKN